MSERIIAYIGAVGCLAETTGKAQWQLYSKQLCAIVDRIVVLIVSVIVDEASAFLVFSSPPGTCL